MQISAASETEIGLIGLFGMSKDHSNRRRNTQIQLPLKNVSFLVQICDGLAQINQTQTYFNNTQQFLEVQFKFPISPSACLHRFVASFSGIHLFGVVKEKLLAQKEYATALKQGKRAAYAEIRQESKDVMAIRIGNIDPKTQVKIEISYIEELKTTLNMFYSFDIQTQMFPRYLNKLSNEDFINSYQGNIITPSGHFQWDFVMRVRTTRKIICHNSLTKNLHLSSSNSSNTDMTFVLDNSGQKKQRSINFIYSTQSFGLPSFVVGNTDQSTTVMVSFVPKFCQLSIGDAEVAAFQDRPIETDFQNVSGEYIFLLDRSGSMGGNRIDNAKKSLIIFLKSLPVDSYFNVVSFGSSHQKMFKQSQKNWNEPMSLSINLIEAMSADMGGTEISSVLAEIFSCPVIEGYARHIFLLTDGDVRNTKSVIDLVRRNVKCSRVHTIGIGSEASRNLIEGCAKSGKGQHVFIGNNENPTDKIIQLLTDSLSEVITNVNLAFDKQLVKSIVPNPSSIPYILKGQVANFYITFHGRLNQQTAIQFSYGDPINKLPFTSSVVIDPTTQSFPFVDKMGHFKVIRQLEESLSYSQDIENRLYYVKPVDRKQQIIDLSTKHQILSTHTSFLCVEKHLVDGRFQEIETTGRIQVDIKQANLSHANQPAWENYNECQSACLDDEEDGCQLQCFHMKDQPSECKADPTRRQQRRVVEPEAKVDSQSSANTMIMLVNEQNTEGYWSKAQLLKMITEQAEMDNLPQDEARNVAITILILRWIKNNIVSQGFSLIVKKASVWLKKQPSFPELAQKYNYVAK